MRHAPASAPSPASWLRRFAFPLGVAMAAGFAMAAEEPGKPAVPTAPPAAARTPGPRALPVGQLPKDARLGELATLDGEHPFRGGADTPEQWAVRAEQLRQRVMLGCGLWPLPAKTPLNAKIHGRIERDDYTVDRVYFESVPGHYVTGSLYRPKGRDGQKLPGMLMPHGHANQGRFNDTGYQGIRKEISIGAERFEVGGRYYLQARCVHLARMGCVAFFYDMEGVADSIQFVDGEATLPDGKHKVESHRLGWRPDMNSLEPGQWGYYSPAADARLQTMFGLQTWNSVRALDFLLTLPEVDPARIGVHGHSGGGTQSMMIAAIDPRVALSFPGVMVSTQMQGGCTCENTHYLRVGAGNIDIAALAAPRPMGVTTADDWTKNLATKGDPDLKKLYGMLKAGDRYKAYFNNQYEHNFNHVSRVQLYGWVNKHFKLGWPEPVLERDYQPLTREEATVWTGKGGKDPHQPPTGDKVGPAHEKAMLHQWADASDQAMLKLVPKGAGDAAGLAKFREVLAPAAAVMIGRPGPGDPARLPGAGQVEQKVMHKSDHGDYLEIVSVLNRQPEGEQLPVVFLHPKAWNGKVVVWLTPTGKAGLFTGEGGAPSDAVKALLAQGTSVCGVDLYMQGEFNANGKTPEKQRLLNVGHANLWRRFSGYTFGYNMSLYAQRVQDVLSVVGFVKQYKEKPKRVALVGLAGAGQWAAGARALAGDAIDLAVIDTGGFRFAKLDRQDHPDFLPGGAKYLDLPGFLALGAPHRLALAGEGDADGHVVAKAYAAAGAAERLRVLASSDLVEGLSKLIEDLE